MKKMITAGLLLLCPLSFASGYGDESGEGETKPAVYWVPVGTQLSQFALFSLPKVKTKISDDKIKVEYELPRELTGAINVVEFEGPRQSGGPIILTGEHGKMQCPTPEDFSDCAVTYRDLTFDAETRTALLSSISNSDEELQKRELVAARFQFGGEPHGFLRVLNGQPTPKY